MGIPKNVQDILDEEGNILGDLLEETGVSGDQGEPDGDEVTTEEPDDDSSQETQEELEGESQEEPGEGEAEEETEEPGEGVLELTPKAKVEEPREDPSELTRRILDKLESISAPSPKEKPTTTEQPVQDTSADPRIKELEDRLIAYENKNDSINREAFISDVKDRVKINLFPSNSFDEIVGSEQFDNYLNQTVLGVSKRTFLKRAMDDRDRQVAFEIFQGFKDSISPKKDTTKNSLSDLAVPEKSGTKSAPKRRSKFDFKQSDFQLKLRQFERGKLNQKDFNVFTDKFNEALDANRVDMDN